MARALRRLTSQAGRLLLFAAIVGARKSARETAESASGKAASQSRKVGLQNNLTVFPIAPTGQSRPEHRQVSVARQIQGSKESA